MKKIFKIALIAAVLFSLFSMTAFADMGSKPRVEIKINNGPQEEYYLDLLYQHDSIGSLWSNIDEDEEYNQDMVDLLFTHQADGWIPAYAGGTNIPMWGGLEAKEDGSHIFSYVGVPDEFKIIIVTRSGDIKTTDVIQRKAMEISLTLDYSDMSYTTKPVWQVYLGQFALTCSVTMIVELIILVLFGFTIKENLKVFIFANLLTQIVFTFFFARSFIYGGTMGSLFAFIPLEVGVTLSELFFYRKMLKGHTDKRKIIYAVAANLATAALTWVNIDALMDFMFKLMR